MLRADLERRLRVLGWRPVAGYGRHTKWRHSRRYCKTNGRHRYPLIVPDFDTINQYTATALLDLACGRRPETR